MKIVIISDLHGNYDALSALPETGDELWVLGDLVNYGPQPREVVEHVRRHANLVMRGNHDHAVGFQADPRCTPRYREMALTTMQYSSARLDSSDKEYLRGLPLTVTVQCDGRNFFLCHAVPSNPLFGYCPEDSVQWIEEVAKANAPDFLFVGHTHTPFVRKIGKTMIVNPGSLGQPKTGRPDACYAVWEDGKIELKQFVYPMEETVRRIGAMPVPVEVVHDLVTVLRTGSV